MSDFLQKFVYGHRSTRMIWLTIFTVSFVTFVALFRPFAAVTAVEQPSSFLPIATLSPMTSAQPLPGLLLLERSQLQIQFFHAFEHEIEIQLMGSLASFTLWLSMLNETDWSPIHAQILPIDGQRLQLSVRLTPHPRIRDGQEHEVELYALAAQLDALPSIIHTPNRTSTAVQSSKTPCAIDCATPSPDPNVKAMPRQHIIWLPPI